MTKIQEESQAATILLAYYKPLALRGVAAACSASRPSKLNERFPRQTGVSISASPKPVCIQGRDRTEDEDSVG
jgi:hypothetical protein